jgi:hypothetical protein
MDFYVKQEGALGVGGISHKNLGCLKIQWTNQWTQWILITIPFRNALAVAVVPEFVHRDLFC